MRQATDRPNFILINCDDLGYGDLGCYGSTRNRTPHLDRLAAEGTRYTDFYMAAPVCSPSRGGMLTGCYPPRISFGTYDNGAGVLFPGHATGLNPGEITIATMLHTQGYATAIVGKWHCGDQPEFLPTKHGFDHYFGIPYSNDMGCQPGPRKRKYPPLPLLYDDAVIQEQPDQAAITERYTDESVRFLRAHRDEPFFLYLAHMYVHRPLIVPQHFLDRSINGRYGAAVECIDWSTGVILRELKQLGIDDNTVVMFTSDNGSRVRDEGGSNGPLRGTKGSTWEGGQRLPFIVRWPGGAPAGRVSSEMLSSLDLLPTFTRLAGTTSPTDRMIDGLDACELLRGATTSPRNTMLFYRGNDLCAVRHGDFKLHVYNRDEGQSALELYNLRDDIGEQRNVAGDHGDMVRAMEAIADAARADMGDALVNATGANRRPAGIAANPRPLTGHDPDYPYFIAEYDLEDTG